MQWNVHSNLNGRHSFMSPSSHSWKNYDDQKLISVFEANKRKIEGTQLHQWAEDLISSVHKSRELIRILKPNRRVPSIDIESIRALGEGDPIVRSAKAKETVFMYVADAIKFDMLSEQALSYDDRYCFGTADAIQFDGYLLRIHDLKTGDTPASIDQLIIYAALFCLEYQYDPNSLMFELRIYQTDQILIHKPTAEEIVNVMNIIVHGVDVLRRYEREANYERNCN